MSHFSPSFPLFSHGLRDSISHYVHPSIFWHFACGSCITAPAQLIATDFVMFSVRPSVRRSVHPSVGPSVRWSVRNPFFSMLEDVCFSIAFARIIHREHDTEQVGGDGVGGGGDGVVTGWWGG